MLRLVLAAVVALLALTGAAPRISPAPVQPKPALWVVKDADTTIYLFGTFHLLPPGTPWFEGPVREAFDRSDEVVLEVKLPDPDPEETQLLALHLARDPSGKPLKARVPAKLAARAEKAILAAGLPFAPFDTARPWFIALTLELMEFQRMGLAPGDGAEMTIVNAADETGKPVSGIETMGEQLRLLSALGSKDEGQYLAYVLDEVGKTDEAIGDLYRCWADGDMDGLAKLFLGDAGRFPEVEKALIDDRNARFAAFIRTRLARPGKVFVGVGAGHLVGPNSVQAKLGGMGIANERLQ